MKKKFLILPLAALLLLVSCDIFSHYRLRADYPGDEFVAWVEQTISGGVQCDPKDRFEPPDTKKLLQSRGIVVFDTETEQLFVCEACGCPSYAAIHYALIHIDKVETAEEIGFELSDGPNRPE